MPFTVFTHSFCFVYFFFAVVFFNQKTHSLATLTGSFSNMKKKLCVNTVRANFPWSNFCILDKEQIFNILTCNIYFKYLANSFISILSCTTVCSRSTPCDIWKFQLRQYFTIATIFQHSGQGDIWCWFTSSFTKQCRVWSFTYSLVTTYMS